MKSMITRRGKALFEGLVRPRWPCPRHNLEKEPRFLFLVVPPHSGSTALAKVLNSARGTAFLQKKGEGQWLVPGLCAPDRWDPDKKINWHSVRAMWLQRVAFIESLVQDVELIIEKSPPNIVRMDRLVEIFPSHCLVALNRDPYANCASILHRNHAPERKSEQERASILSVIAGDWLSRSGWIKRWIDEWQLTFFTYKEFCADPASCVSRIAEGEPALRTVDVNKRIKVKDYRRQGIVNFNEAQISKLSQQEIEAISAILAQDPALVSFFGYEIL